MRRFAKLCPAMQITSVFPNEMVLWPLVGKTEKHCENGMELAQSVVSDNEFE
jgi:hypothetical protein